MLESVTKDLEYNFKIILTFKCNFCQEIIDLFNYSYYKWKLKLILVLIHNFPTSLIISDDFSETND